MIRTCLCLITRPAAAGADPARGAVIDVLVGFKKTGFGAGRWVGIGGHIEEGENLGAEPQRRSRRTRPAPLNGARFRGLPAKATKTPPVLDQKRSRSERRGGSGTRRGRAQNPWFDRQVRRAHGQPKCDQELNLGKIFFDSFLVFFAADAERGFGARFEALDRNLFAAVVASAERAVFDFLDRFLDLVQEGFFATA